MDFDFKNLINKIIVVYLDDMIIFSKHREDHVKHVVQVLEICKEFGISLNPKKSIFGVTEGKILGHIISKEGTHMDPKGVISIKKIPFPTCRKYLRSFSGKVNFLRRFVLDFEKLIFPLTKMLKQNLEFKWYDEGKIVFESIKEALISAPTMVQPNFSKPFKMYSYASDHTISLILM